MYLLYSVLCRVGCSAGIVNNNWAPIASYSQGLRISGFRGFGCSRAKRVVFGSLRVE